jgi:hypothetical protein
LDFSAIRSNLQMLEQSRIYMIGIDHISKVADLQGTPKEPAYAAGVVAPGHSGSVFQLFIFQIPRPRFFDFRKGGFFAGGKVFGAPMLFLRDGLEEILGLAADVGGRIWCHHSITALA